MYPDLLRRRKTSLCNGGPEQTKHLPIDGKGGRARHFCQSSHVQSEDTLNQPLLRNFTIQLSRDFIQNHSPTRRINFAKKLYNAGGGNRFFNPHWRTAPPAEKEVPGKTQPPRPLFTYDGNTALTLDKFLRKGREVERKVILTRIRKARLNQPRLRLHILSAAILLLMFVIFVIPDVSIFRNKQ